MSKPVNFNNIKKRYLTVTLADDNKTTVMITTPTKAIMGKLIDLEDTFNAINDGETISNEIIDNLYESCAEIMSRNKTNTQISSEFLAEIFDFEDIMYFFNAYMDFVMELKELKN